MADIDDTIPVTGEITVKTDARASLVSVRGRIGGLPDSADPAGNLAAPHVGKVVVIGSKGAQVAGEGDDLHFAGAAVRGSRLSVLTITGSTTLTDNPDQSGQSHLGALIKASSSSELVVKLDPARIADGFQATLLRYGTGEVTFACEAGLTLRHAAGHTRINARYEAVTVARIGADIFLWGATKA